MIRTRVVSSALSLRPDELLAAACAEGNEIALQILECWRFSEPVTLMPANDFDELVRRNTFTFSAHYAE